MEKRVDLGIAGLDSATRIGEGGNAVVYRARQPDLDRDVAVKVLKQSDDDTRRRFHREQRAMGRLGEHEGIVSVYSTGFTADDHPYLVMPLLAGALDDELDSAGNLAWTDAITIMRDVCSTVQFAHDHGVIHRDLKPGNLIRTRTGRVLVADFGIARVTTAATSLMSTSFSLTPVYSPPEAFEDGDATSATDVYSLGATLYALIAGHPPFVGPGESVSILALIKRINERSVEPLGHPVPALVDEILARALAKDPADRFPTPGDMSRALAEVTPDLPVARPEPGVVPPDQRTDTIPGRETSPSLPASTAPTSTLTSTLVVDPDRHGDPLRHDPVSVSFFDTGPSRPGRRVLTAVVALVALALAAVVGVVAAVRDDDTIAGDDPTQESADAVDGAAIAADPSLSAGAVDADGEAVADGQSDPGSAVGLVPLGPVSLGRPVSVGNFRLERTEGAYAIGIDLSRGGRDLVVLDRETMVEVGRAPLEPAATNTSDAVESTSGEVWIAIAGQRSIAVFAPACACIDRFVPVDDPGVSTLVAAGPFVWIDLAGPMGNRIVGLDASGGIAADVTPLLGARTRLWNGLLDGRLVVVGDDGVVTIDPVSQAVAGPFAVAVGRADRNGPDAVRFHWSDPETGTLHSLDPTGQERVATVVAGPAEISSPVIEVRGGQVWVSESSGPSVVAFDPTDLSETMRVPLDVVPSGAALKVGGGLLWVSSIGEVLGLDPSNGQVVVRLGVGGDSFAAFDVIDGQVWAVDPTDTSTVTRYDVIVG